MQGQADILVLLAGTGSVGCGWRLHRPHQQHAAVQGQDHAHLGLAFLPALDYFHCGVARVRSNQEVAGLGLVAVPV